MVYHGVEIDRKAIERFCLKHHIRKLSLFGSILREDFSPDSDVDVLIEFVPGQRIGLIGLAEMEIELSSILGRKVDLNTPGFLSPYFRDSVMASAVVQYDAAA